MILGFFFSLKPHEIATTLIQNADDMMANYRDFAARAAQEVIKRREALERGEDLRHSRPRSAASAGSRDRSKAGAAEGQSPVFTRDMKGGGNVKGAWRVATRPSSSPGKAVRLGPAIQKKKALRTCCDLGPITTHF